MKFLKQINFDSKMIIQDLRGLNATLLDVIESDQQHIYELMAIVKNQKEEIERLQMLLEERNDKE